MRHGRRKTPLHPTETAGLHLVRGIACYSPDGGCHIRMHGHATFPETATCPSPRPTSHLSFIHAASLSPPSRADFISGAHLRFRRQPSSIKRTGFNSPSAEAKWLRRLESNQTCSLLQRLMRPPTLTSSLLRIKNPLFKNGASNGNRTHIVCLEGRCTGRCAIKARTRRARRL